MAEKRVIELEIETNAKSLKAQLKEAQADVQQLSEKFGATSQEAVNAAKKAAQLKDAIADAKDLTDAFNPDAKFNALSRSVGGVLDGFQAFEGALGLIGVESEKLQETMVRVQSVMALSQGLQGLMEAKDSFKQLGAVAANALKGIRTGLAATGIGLFVVALGTVVAYWDDIKAAVSGVSEEQKKLNIEAEKNAQTSKEQYTNLQLQENTLKLQGKTEKEILKIRIDKLNTTIKDEEARIKGLEETSKLEIAAAKRNQEITKSIIQGALNFGALGLRLLVAPIDMVLETANLVSEKLGFGKITATNLNKEISKLIDVGADIGSKFLFDPAETKAESEANIKEAKKGLAQMKSDRDGFLLSLKENNQKEREDNKSTSDSIIENKKAELDALIELEIRKDQTDKKRLEDLLAERLKLEKLKGNQLLLAEQDNAEKVRKAIEEDNSEVIKLETKKLDTLKVLRDSKLEGLKGSLNAEVEAERQAAEHKQKVLEAQAVRAQKLEENSQSFKVKTAQQGLELISNITELFGKKSEKAAKRAFQIQKAASIASALITTYQNATSAYASQFVPIPDPSSPVRGGIAAGMAVAAGLVNVAKIASQKFEGGSPAGGGGAPAGAGGGGTMQAPNFSVIGSSGVNQLAQLQQQPTRAYVVSGEVTSQQALDRNRVQNATL